MLDLKKILIILIPLGLSVIAPFFDQTATLHASVSQDKYYAAEGAYKKLRHHSKKQKYRENWLKCIKRFQAVYDHAPDSQWAAAGLFMAAQLYHELYKRSFAQRDQQEAVNLHRKIIAEFPASRYHSKSLDVLKSWNLLPSSPKSAPPTPPPQTKAPLPASVRLHQNQTKQDPKLSSAQVSDQSTYPEPQKAKGKQQANNEYLPSVPVANNISATINGIHFQTHPQYTRVVIDIDHKRPYSHHLLNQNRVGTLPQQLSIEVPQCRLDPKLCNVIPIDDVLLKEIKTDQPSAEKVSVTITIKSFKNYKIFSLTHPFRIVIDVWGNENNTTETAALFHDYKRPDKRKEQPSAGRKPLADDADRYTPLGTRRIVIDPGHGGKDFGAPGYYRGIHEKNVVLAIARKLARILKRNLNYDVMLTRSDDRFLTLEERTAIANRTNADLFISIHTNASKDRRAYGSETYFLNLATDDDAIMVANRENASSTRNISDLQAILNDLMQNAKINESSRLATSVEKAMYKNLKSHYSRIKSKGVKQALFYVLLDARMPSILIETGFISNSRECRRLNYPKYQERLSKAIAAGIEHYMQETNPTAFIKSNRAWMTQVDH